MTAKDPHLVKTPIDKFNSATVHDDTVNNDTVYDDNEVNEETVINKGTETLEADHIDTKHVNDGDNPARQPDRRDQEGAAFDDGVNESATPDKSEPATARQQDVDETPQSREITDMNRYDTVDNAQKRVLPKHDE